MPAQRRSEKLQRRILSMWFPRLGAERVLRAEPALAEVPLATVAEVGQLRQLAATTAAAEAAGLTRGQPLSEAVMFCPDLVTRPANPIREAAFLAALRRWAGKFSPWVAEDGSEALMVDLTGCAHLFGGEAELLARMQQDCTDLGLTLCAGIADTPGAAWALARYAGGGGLVPGRSGDAIDQEAPSTRSRAEKRDRGRDRGAPPPRITAARGSLDPSRIAPPGGTRQALAPLPIAALRVDPKDSTGLARLGLRRISDVMGMPRAALARRFGRSVMQRLDQALGVVPEPISPAQAPLHFAARMSFPEPIGLEADIAASLDRLLPVLCARLRERGHGARHLRLELGRVDGGGQVLRLGLARASDRADKIKPLFEMKLGEVEAEFGIDRVRLVADVTEPLDPTPQTGAWATTGAARRPCADEGQDLSDLIARIGARVGLEQIRRQHPADSHIPEKTSVIRTVAWSEPHPAGTWPHLDRPRPLTLFRPEPVKAPNRPEPPRHFRWRGRRFQTRMAVGPERIAPEWWLDDPAWRSGLRDYWRVTTMDGHCLWLYFAHGAAMSGGWFAHGDFN